jgi:glyoxylase-like metal-dependent hydrolase (beta-lactamase superfamily II)
MSAMVQRAVVVPCTELITRVTDRAGVGSGANTYIVRNPGTHRTVVVDPGSVDGSQLRQITGLGAVELILLTDGNPCRLASAHRLARMTGAPVRAIGRSSCREGEPLTDGEVINAGGGEIRVLATPGSTINSARFVVMADRSPHERFTRGSVLTGDAVQRTTSAPLPPIPALSEYLQGLEQLSGLSAHVMFPGRGEPCADVALLATALLAHHRRLSERVERVSRDLAGGSGLMVPTVERIVETLYPQIGPDGASRTAAQDLVAAHLDNLLRQSNSRTQTG